MGKFIDLKNKRFSRWLVVEKDPVVCKDRCVRWICLCDCGEVKSIKGTLLRNGSSKSCGCLRKDTCSKLGKLRGKNLVGEKYGNLLVKERVGQDNQGNFKYLCFCDCGEQVEVRGNSLTSGNTASCGKCRSISSYERLLKDFLDLKEVSYEQQKSFSNCRYPDTGALVRFDFFIDNRFVIEVDGRQHYEYDKTGWNNKRNFERTQRHDLFRNKWCKDNNIPLYRLPYYHVKDFVSMEKDSEAKSIRHGIFKGFREDKNAQECKLEEVFL